jgi:hypothetical protein
MFAHEIIINLTSQNRYLFRRSTLIAFLVTGEFPYHMYAKAPQIKGDWDAALFDWTDEQINVVIDELIANDVLNERASDGKLIPINHESRNAFLKQLQIEKEIYQAWLDKKEAETAMRQRKSEPTEEGLALLALFNQLDNTVAS